MSSSGGVFSQTLQSITDTKLAELSKYRTFFEGQKAVLIKTVNTKKDPQQRLRLLLNGVKDSFRVKTNKRERGGVSSEVQVRPGGGIVNHLEVLVNNLQRFLDQARYDPSISPKLLQDWEESLIKQLDIQSLKYQYATLYGQLVTEWLSSEKVAEASKRLETEEVEGFEKVEWKKKDEARAKWESIVFEPFEVDQVAINNYLENLFGKNGTDKNIAKALQGLRWKVKAFETTLASPGQFNRSVLRWVIKGLLNTDLLNDEKKAVLKDFLGNPVILVEVADVLNMRIASLQTWGWEDHVPLEMRRNVNGDTRIYMEEDILQVIFLQYLGVKWSVFFKSAFKAFSQAEGAWTSNYSKISDDLKQRRTFFLGNGYNHFNNNFNDNHGCVQSRRYEVHQSRHFLSQLLDGVDQEFSAADGETEANYAHQVMNARTSFGAPQSTVYQSMGNAQPTQIQLMQLQQQQQQSGLRLNSLRAPKKRKSARMSTESYDIEEPLDDDDGEDEDRDDDAKARSAMQTKQLLLHLLSSEIILNTELHGELTCLRSEFESWLPTLPHTTILSVLTFLGLSQKWLAFFGKFLQAPLKFIEDGASGQVKKRKRGVPSSHTLSDVFGEVVLFCMDYSVNQSTEGTLLYRMHDDFWIWSYSHQTVVTAWNSMTEFAETMGVSLNSLKTGTVRIMKDKNAMTAIDPSLPRGEIRWGFLYLDSMTGRFLIDQRMVDTHILELQRQLEGKTSIFGYIQAWNTYAGTFFNSNFGKPANCFGREHVDMMLSTLERIQRCIFPSTTTGENNINSIAAYLKTTITKRFGISDIPDGFLYFTTPLGGLELHNPFIGLLQLRDSVWEKPSSAFESFFPAEKVDYEKTKALFIKNQTALFNQRNSMGPNSSKLTIPEFFSFEEYTRYREDFSDPTISGSATLLPIYDGLLEMPKEESVLVDERMREALKALVGTGGKEIGRDWKGLSNYWRWIVQLHGKEMVERFGGLNAVDSGVLPVGMVGLVRGGSVKWEG